MEECEIDPMENVEPVNNDEEFRWTVLQGDCIEVMRTCPDNYVDAMVTDPPAGVAFMNRDWDCFRRRHNPKDVGRENVFGRTSEHAPHSYGESERGNFIAFMTEVMKEALRVVKPGSHAFVWSLPRTSHWTAMALEDAGWDIRDRVAHLHAFGSGFPKSKQLDNGVGTALKPGYEVWLLARKPVEGSITSNYKRWGTGGLNIDACRVHRDANDVPGWHESGAKGSGGYQGEDTFKIHDMSSEEIQERCGDKGRWPPDLLLSHGATCSETCAVDCPVAELDRQSGYSRSSKTGGVSNKMSSKGYAGGALGQRAGSTFEKSEIPIQVYGDSGGTSRFFPTFRYQAKPSRSEREVGCEDLPTAILNRVNPGGLENEPRFAPVKVKNNHPTPKGIELARWLSRLITPPGGIILDPFAGSGSLGCGALLEGFRWVGIEQDEQYCAIARARLRYWDVKCRSER